MLIFVTITIALTIQLLDILTNSRLFNIGLG